MLKKCSQWVTLVLPLSVPVRVFCWCETASRWSRSSVCSSGCLENEGTKRPSSSSLDRGRSDASQRCSKSFRYREVGVGFVSVQVSGVSYLRGSERQMAQPDQGQGLNGQGQGEALSSCGRSRFLAFSCFVLLSCFVCFSRP